MDDDIVVEPESIIRLLTFADRCKTPTIVGGHMFDLYDRTVLHTFGEVVNPYSSSSRSLPSEDMSLGTTSVREPAPDLLAAPPLSTWTTTAGGCA